MTKSEILHFTRDEFTPNNSLPVIVYRDVPNSLDMDPNSSLLNLFISNGWTNNWEDIIMTENHYHSTTHEVIGIKTGEVDLKLGGTVGSIVTVKSGDVIIIPAGVGHYSLSNEKGYRAIGGYPNGADWDMIFDEKEKLQAATERITQIPTPVTDPVFGSNGGLGDYWK